MLVLRVISMVPGSVLADLVILYHIVCGLGDTTIWYKWYNVGSVLSERAANPKTVMSES